MATYVNQGPDPRAGGLLGSILAGLQRRLSFRSTDPPATTTFPIGGTEILLAWPPFLSINVPRGGGRYASVRLGWRYDKHWGDKTPCGGCAACLDQRPWDCENPTLNDHAGGYIADVILKTNMDRRVHF